MHVVRELRLAGSRAAAGESPRVRSGRGRAQSSLIEQVAHFRGLARGQQPPQGQLVAPGGGQIAIHVEAEQQRVHHAPGTRLITEQGEFQRKPAQVSGKEGVDAAGVGRHGGAVGRRQGDVSLFGDAPHAQLARIAVGFERRRADDVCQVSGRKPPQRIHLKQAVLRRHIAFDEERVFEARSANVRHSARVEGDAHARPYFRLDGTGAARQRAPNVPEQPGRYHHQRERDDNVDESYDSRTRGPRHVRLQFHHSGWTRFEKPKRRRCAPGRPAFRGFGESGPGLRNSVSWLSTWTSRPRIR